MNPISNWLCTNPKNLFVKIIHPGGHVELHDRLILASELLVRNPKCCVAHTTVFQNPYDVVSPADPLTLGRSYYIVPIATIRKLELQYLSSQNKLHGLKDKEKDSTCWLMRGNKKDCRVKNGKSSSRVKIKAVKRSKELKGFDEKGIGNGGSRLSVASLDNWQPGLERIIEE